VRLFNGSGQVQSVTLAWNGNKKLRLTKTDLWGNGHQAVANPLTLQPMEIVTLHLSR
jgi:hypothetical protein